MLTQEMTDTEFAAHWRAWANDNLARSWSMARDTELTNSARELHRVLGAISREEQVAQLWLSAERQGFSAAAHRAGTWLLDAGHVISGYDIGAARAEAAREWLHIAHGRYDQVALADAVAGQA